MLGVPSSVPLKASKSALKIAAQDHEVRSAQIPATADKPRVATAIVYCDASKPREKKNLNMFSGRIAEVTCPIEVPPVADRGLVTQATLAVGQQDIDSSGLQAPNGIDVMGASSEQLILESECFELTVDAEVIFQLNYGALVRAMTSPFVTKVMVPASV